ncbi:MAG: transposase, partial [Ktedonobacterales bacterium]|nr:transposase [Ktedonobacterales bacterium]
MPQPPAPLFSEESIYIGIDIGKAKHIAGFVSVTLLERHQRFESCPTFTFSQSREGFHALLERIRSLAQLEHCFVLMEQTGHSHKLLEQFLVELDLPVYVMHVQRRPVGLIKTDKRDALVRVFGATADGQFVEHAVWWSYARLHPTHVFP